MNKYIIGAVVLAIVLIIGGKYYDGGGEEIKAATSVTSPLLVTESSHDFGEIDIFGGKVKTTYTLKNDGTEDITITSAQTSCMCTEGEIAGLTFGMHGSDVKSVIIPAGGEEVVTATFDPLAHGPNGVGPITRELMVKTNSTETPDIRMKFSGNVIKNEE